MSNFLWNICRDKSNECFPVMSKQGVEIINSIELPYDSDRYAFQYQMMYLVILLSIAFIIVIVLLFIMWDAQLQTRLIQEKMLKIIPKLLEHIEEKHSKSANRTLEEKVVQEIDLVGSKVSKQKRELDVGDQEKKMSNKEQLIAALIDDHIN